MVQQQGYPKNNLPRQELSPREFEVLSATAQGKSDKQIAYELGISTQTIKIHQARIREKLGANDRTHAVVKALFCGLLNLGNYGSE